MRIVTAVRLVRVHTRRLRSFPGSIHDPARRRAPFAASRVHRVGVAFPEGLKLLPFYENLAKRQLLPFYAHSLLPPFTLLRPFGHFYRLTQHTNFSSACCACERKGARGRKNRRNPRTGRISDVQEEGAVERGRENRLARATKSSFDLAVKSFNMVYAILVQLDTFTVLRQNALTFTLPPPYGGAAQAASGRDPSTSLLGTACGTSPRPPP